MTGVRLVAGRETAILLRSPVVLLTAAAFHLWNGLAYRRLAADAIGAASGTAAAGGIPPGVSEGVVAPLFTGLLFMLALFVPLLAMRSLSEERRSGFEDLLASLPLTSPQIVLGKFAALAGATLLLTLPPAALVVCLAGPVAPEWGVLAAAVLGLALAGAAFAAVGLWASSLASNPVLAAVIAVTGLLVLFFVDRFWGPGAFLSARLAYEPFARGVIGTAAVTRWLVLGGVFLFLAAQTLELRRRTR